MRHPYDTLPLAAYIPPTSGVPTASTRQEVTIQVPYLEQGDHSVHYNLQKAYDMLNAGDQTGGLEIVDKLLQEGRIEFKVDYY